MEYKFTGTITLDDFTQMNNFYSKEIFLKGKFSVFLYISLAVFIVFIVFNAINYKKIDFFEDILPILIFIALFVFLSNKPKLIYKRFYEKDKIMQEEQTFTVNETEIVMSSSSATVKIIKDKVNKIKHDKDTIYIFISEHRLVLIKSRYLNGAVNFEELREFIKTHFQACKPAK